MNYDNRNPTISFRIDHNRKTKLDKLALMKKLSSANELSKEIVEMYLKNKLVEKTEDLPTEKIKLQIEKLKQEIEYMKIKNAFATNFNQPLSRSATIHIKPEIIVETPNSSEPIRSPYDASNKRLQCMECSALICWKNQDEYVESIGKLETHLMLNHNRRFNVLEKEVIDNLRYEGDST